MRGFIQPVSDPNLLTNGREILRIHYISVVVQVDLDGNRLAFRLGQGRYVSVQHLQLGDEGRIQALHLRIQGNLLSIPPGGAQQLIHILIPEIVFNLLPPVRLRQIHLHQTGSVGEAAQRLLRILPHRANVLLCQGKSAIVEVIRRTDHKIRAAPVAQVFVHVKAGDKGGQQIQQHHGQRQGNHHQRSLPPASAEVRFCHGERCDLPGSPGPFTRLLHLRIPHRLHGGYAARDPAGAGAGQQHRQQGERRRAKEDPGRQADGGIPAAVI